MTDEDKPVAEVESTGEAEQTAEDRWAKRAFGTTDLAARGYRSFWD